LNEHDTTEQSEDWVSKTQRKREAESQQDLGQALTRLRPAVLDQLPIDETLRDAIEEYHRVAKSFGAKRRQLQFIGRLMRERDAEAIVQAMDALSDSSQHPVRKREVLAQLAELTLQQGDATIQELVSRDHSLPRQTLRQLSRELHKLPEAATAKRKSLADRAAQLLQTSAIAQLDMAALFELIESHKGDAGTRSPEDGDLPSGQ
jgi:ribosome-associated protein